jgi:hypothetical protein
LCVVSRREGSVLPVESVGPPFGAKVNTWFGSDEEKIHTTRPRRHVASPAAVCCLHQRQGETWRSARVARASLCTCGFYSA